MGATDSDDRDLEAGSEPGTAELGRRAQATGRILGLVALLAMPAWSGFDWLLEPEHARVFTVVRLAGDVPMALLLWVLWTRPVSRVRSEVLTFAVLSVPQAEIAWMVPRVMHERAFYLLGFTLAIYGSGCLMTGRPRWTGALIAVTWAGLGLSFVAGSGAMTMRDLVAAAFYLATSSLIGLLAHVLRYRLARRELLARIELEREQARTHRLLEQLDRLSHEDALTGLANRRRWDQALEAAGSRARLRDEPVAVVLADVDHFKQINDRHGHDAGDEALRAVAAMLLDQVGDGLVARLGGDELAVLLPGQAVEGARDRAERIRLAAAALHVSGAAPCPVSLSLGVAAAAGEQAHEHALMQEADTQLYLAKQTRNAVRARRPVDVPAQQPRSATASA